MANADKKSESNRVDRQVGGGGGRLIEREGYLHCIHIDVEAGLSLMKSTIAERGMGVTCRPYRTKHIAF